MCEKWALGIDLGIGQNFRTETSGENNDDTAHHHRRREDRGRTGPGQGIRDLLDYLLADFLRWQAFDKSARVANHSTAGVIELMPTADSDLYLKYVNGHSGNPAAGLSTVMAFGALVQVSTGEPLLISELTLTTALRTAATSALAARALARPGSRSMALGKD